MSDVRSYVFSVASLVVLFIFFFKQKTAYEMRISDWSSDVCSSDLRLDAWLALQLTDNPAVAAVERDAESGERRWFVRVRGEEKDVFTIWFHLRQRTLHYETYVMPADRKRVG